MKQLTPAEFKAEISKDPAWASKLTEPVEITEFCDMKGTNITHLSPLLHFTARSSVGNCANFIECTRLKVAEGHFAGLVSFQKAGIERIGELHIAEPNISGNAASFWGCTTLEIAEGSFPGGVDFECSGIRKIGNLTITAPNKENTAACFDDCKALKLAEGTFPGHVTFRRSGIRKIGELTIQIQPFTLEKLQSPKAKSDYKLSLQECDQLQYLPAKWRDNNSVEMDAATHSRLEALQTQRKAVGKTQRTQPDLEI